MFLKQITKDDFESFSACPYCGDPKPEGALCCGEIHDATEYIVYAQGNHSMSEDDFNYKYEVVDSLPRDCDCEKTCFCEPESTEDR